VFNNNRKTCDVLLHNESFKDNISRKLFRITINTNTRMFIVNNKFTYDIVVTFYRFKELMLRKALISIFAHNNI
jgi:hypothetical protein